MSLWRREAMAVFPDRLPIIRQSTSLVDVWFTLHEDLQGAYRSDPQNADLIARIWRFAAWCYSPLRHRSVRNAVAVAFYEHLPHFGPARRALPEHLDRATFEELIPAFKSTMSKSELTELVSEFMKAKGVKGPELKLALERAS